MFLQQDSQPDALVHGISRAAQGTQLSARDVSNSVLFFPCACVRLCCRSRCTNHRSYATYIVGLSLAWLPHVHLPANVRGLSSVLRHFIPGKRVVTLIYNHTMQCSDVLFDAAFAQVLPQHSGIVVWSAGQIKCSGTLVPVYLCCSAQS